jgi:hypothetical protein
MSSEPTTRDRRMALKIADLIAEAVVEHVSDAEQAAADASGDTDGDKPVVAKLAISVTWPAGASNPEISIKCSYSVRRVIEVAAMLDDPQIDLFLEKEANYDLRK